MNNASQQRLTKVHPELATRVKSLIESLAEQGHVIEVVQGLRTFAEQDELFRQGRSKPGQVVTNAKGGQSNHNYGLAVDLCPFVNNKPKWDAEATKRGLEWGGNWKKFIDKPHVQLPGLTVTQCFSIFKENGLQGVWDAVPQI